MHSNKEKRDKVIFLGAGGTCEAGLPLTNNLLNTMKEFFDTHNTTDDRINFQRFSNAFNEYREKIRDIARLNQLGSEIAEIDIELFFTFISLAIKLDRISKYTDTKDYERFENSFITHLTEYMAHKAFYYQEHSKNSQQKRYLKNMINSTNTIVTTNWDLMLETELQLNDDWSRQNFRQVYGIELDIVDGLTKKIRGKIPNRTPVSKSVPPASEFRIYKLHGSVGWLCYEESKIIYDRITRGLLGMTGPHTNDNTKPMLLTPSFIKHFEDKRMLEIWSSAYKSLAKAKVVEIVGYSLPEGDQAVRSLLLPLRNSDKKIIIIEKTLDSKNKWEDFLGKNITIYPCGAEQYYLHDIKNFE